MESSFDRDVMLVWVQIMTFWESIVSILILILFYAGLKVQKINYLIQVFLFYLYQISLPWSCLLWVFSRKKCSYISVAKFNFKFATSGSHCIWFLENSSGCVVLCGVIFCFFFTRANDTSEYCQQSEPLGQTSLYCYTQEFIGRSNNYIGSHSKKWYLLLFFCLSSLWGICPVSWHSQNALQRYCPGVAFLSFSQESVWRW